MAASVVKSTRDFFFIAVESASGKVMAHASRAIDVLSRADRIGPNLEIEIPAEGRRGVWICNRNVLLDEARPAFSEMSMRADWAGDTRLRPGTGRP